jgi:anaerobic magnesium-protoporphyrin IX monomethyl ester cyclase
MNSSITCNSNKRIMLIHPLGYNDNPEEGNVARIANIMPPIGLCSIASWLEKHGHKTSIYDYYAYPEKKETITLHIKKENPDYIGISTTTSSFLDGIEIARLAKEVKPDTKIVFGGVHISALKDELLQDYPVIDFGVVGEGEETLLELIERESSDFNKIKGLIYRKNSKVVFNGRRNKLMDLDNLTFPSYHKLKGFPHHYQLPIFNYPKYPNTIIVTSRGCPFQCSYCDRSVFLKSYRYNSAEYILELLKYLRKRYNIRHVNIYDDTFLLNRNRVMEFCKLKIRNRVKTTFNCAARAEQVDMELLKLLKKAGCWMISLGIETGDDELLKRHRSYGKKEPPPDILNIMRKNTYLIKKAGMRAKGLFMMGLPGETEASIDRSMNYVFSLPLDDFNLSRLTPFPGSPMYRDIHKHGVFQENWRLMNALNFVFIPNGFTKERLNQRYHEFYRRYFHRQKVFLNYISMIWKSPHSWYRFIKNFFNFISFAKSYKKKNDER